MSKIQNQQTGAKADADEQLKDYKGEVVGLLGNIRTPAALFAGGSAGAELAMPVSMTPEGLKLDLVKRIYALLMMSAFSSRSYRHRGFNADSRPTINSGINEDKERRGACWKIV